MAAPDYDKNIAVDKINLEFWNGVTLLKIVAQLQGLMSRHGAGAFLVPDIGDRYEVWRPRTPTEQAERNRQKVLDAALQREHRHEQWLELCKEFGPPPPQTRRKGR